MARCKCQVSLMLILLALFLLAAVGEGLHTHRRPPRHSGPGKLLKKFPDIVRIVGKATSEVAGEVVDFIKDLFNKDDDRRPPVVVVQQRPTAAPAKNGAASSGAVHGIITTIIPVVWGVLLLHQRLQ